MLSKNELTAFLEESLKIEEAAVSLYTRHLNDTQFFSGLGGGKADDTKTTLNVLAEDSKRHAKMISGMLKKIQKDGKSVY